MGTEHVMMRINVELETTAEFPGIDTKASEQLFSSLNNRKYQFIKSLYSAKTIISLCINERKKERCLVQII